MEIKCDEGLYYTQCLMHIEDALRVLQRCRRGLTITVAWNAACKPCLQQNVLGLITYEARFESESRCMLNILYSCQKLYSTLDMT